MVPNEERDRNERSVEFVEEPEEEKKEGNTAAIPA